MIDENVSANIKAMVNDRIGRRLKMVQVAGIALMLLVIVSPIKKLFQGFFNF